MKKDIYLLVIFICVPISLFGQMTYIKTDTSIIYGCNLIENNSIQSSSTCQELYHGSKISYSPYQVIEFQYSDGRIYLSKAIITPDSTRRVFLERLVDGKISLYFYKTDTFKTFFVETDSINLIMLPKKNGRIDNYKGVLKDISKDCPKMSFEVSNVAYSKKSLAMFISRYNSCSNKAYPRFKFGVVLGFEFATFKTNGNNKNANFEYFDFTHNGSFTVGAFVNQPIALSDFSFYGELYFAKHDFSYNKSIYIKDLDFVANQSSIRLPLMIRYAYPFNLIRPFMNTGFIGSYNYVNETYNYEMKVSGKIYELVDYKDPTHLVSDLNVGFCIGGGIEINILHNYSILIELRYTNHSAFNGSDPLKLGGYNLMTGFSF